MALLFIDGFDHYTSITQKWSNYYSEGGISMAMYTNGGRRDGGRIATTTYNFARYCAATKDLPVSSKTLIVGIAIYLPASPARSHCFALKEGGVVHGAVGFDTGTRLFYVKNGAGNVIGYASDAVALASWHYVELKYTVDDTVGAVQMRIDSRLVLDLAGIDTRNGGTLGEINRFTLGDDYFRNLLGPVSYDDLYICNTDGLTNNDFLGDCRVDTVRPDADGVYQDFVPSVAGPHYSLVDESTPSTTDYVDGASLGARETYGCTSLPAMVAARVYGVQVCPGIYADDAGGRSIVPMMRSEGSDVTGVSKALTTSFLYHPHLFETAGDGTNWSDAKVNAAEFGVMVTE